MDLYSCLETISECNFESKTWAIQSWFRVSLEIKIIINKAFSYLHYFYCFFLLISFALPFSPLIMSFFPLPIYKLLLLITVYKCLSLLFHFNFIYFITHHAFLFSFFPSIYLIFLLFILSISCFKNKINVILFIFLSFMNP